jgi:hypothetical protein
MKATSILPRRQTLRRLEVVDEAVDMTTMQTLE